MPRGQPHQGKRTAPGPNRERVGTRPSPAQPLRADIALTARRPTLPGPAARSCLHSVRLAFAQQTPALGVIKFAILKVACPSGHSISTTDTPASRLTEPLCTKRGRICAKTEQFQDGASSCQSTGGGGASHAAPRR
jgi:hypothetical protein